MKKIIIMYINRKLRSEEINAIRELFSKAYRNVKFISKSPVIVEYQDDLEFKMEDIIEGIMADLIIDIHTFISKNIDNTEDYLDFIKPLLSNINILEKEYFLYEADVIIKNIRKEVGKEIKKQVLKDVIDDELLKIAKVFLECNMNTSHTATKLYMHRNTLINKLDRFKELSGYDLRKFTEAYIIYSLLK